jgi:hypothetical protein
MNFFSRFAFVPRLILLVTVVSPLGGCLDAVVNPLNSSPSAYDDSVCKHTSASKQQVNYGCVAGTELSLRN